LKRVLGNLVSNAIRHGGGDVQVTTSRDDGCVEIHVLDRGPGIDGAQVPHVFDRFFKADPARGGGAGLGLSIALENAHLQNGSIIVANREGGGARFTLRLPAAPVASPGAGEEP
ncbi:MAG TPA: ATP-binding protein, partial [Acidimicrobiales bacterium]|nr:ATP-binding protein [Acidimicrobiales bacterium]